MSDSELIKQGISQAETEGREIDDRTARIIASQWHGGQTSQLYSFASTGCIPSEDMWHNELAEDYKTASAEDRTALDWFGTYLLHAGVRGPVEGWSNLHW